MIKALAIIITFFIYSVQCFKGQIHQNLLKEQKQRHNMWPFNSKPEATGVAIIDAILAKNMDEMNAILARNPKAINDTTSNGSNAMHFIAKLGHYKYPPDDIPKLLITSKIDINAKNIEGKTSLVISLLSGWQKIAMLLLDNGVDRSGVTAEVKQKITCPDCKRVVKLYNL